MPKYELVEKDYQQLLEVLQEIKSAGEFKVDGGISKYFKSRGLKYYRALPTVLIDHPIIKVHGTRFDRHYTYISEIEPNIKMAKCALNKAAKKQTKQMMEWRRKKEAEMQKQESIEQKAITENDLPISQESKVRTTIEVLDERIEAIQKEIAQKQEELQHLETAKKIMQRL